MTEQQPPQPWQPPSIPTPPGPIYPPQPGQPQYGYPGQPQPYQYGPQPGWQQPPAPRPPKRKHTARNVILGIGFVVVAAIIGGVIAGASSGHKTVSTAAVTSASSTSVASAAGSAPATTKAASAPSSAAKQTAHVGSTVNLSSGDQNTNVEKLSVTLVQVKDNAPATDQYSTPDAGDKYYAAQFRLVNTSSQAYSDSPDNGATAIDAQGQQFQASYGDTAAGPSFPGNTTIAPGQTALGWITFEVPIGSTITGIQFTLNSGFSNTGQWTVP